MMYYVTYNPYWHAPDHLVRKTIAPNRLRQGMPYLKSHGYHVIDEWSEDAKEIDPTTIDWKAAAAGTLHLRVRQDPGPLNSMGILKFPFPNPEDIYLHDTPDKVLFAKGAAISAMAASGLKTLGGSDGGCSARNRSRLARSRRSGCSCPGVADRAHLPHRAGDDGKLSYLNDFYGWDKTAPRSSPQQQTKAQRRAAAPISALTTKENRPGLSPGPVILCRRAPLRSRALAPVAAAEAEAAEPGRCPLPGSPNRPGTSASPEAAAEAAGAAAEAAEAAATEVVDHAREQAVRPEPRAGFDWHVVPVMGKLSFRRSRDTLKGGTSVRGRYSAKPRSGHR